MRNFLDWHVDMSGGRRGYLNYPIYLGRPRHQVGATIIPCVGVWTVQEQSGHAPLSLCSSLRM